MDLISLTQSYVLSFDKKNLDEVGQLMSDVFTLSDGVVNGLGPKDKALIYIAELMNAYSQRFRFEAVDILAGENFTILEFKLYLDNATYHGVDIIQWRDGLMINMKAFLNEID